MEPKTESTFRRLFWTRIHIPFWVSGRLHFCSPNEELCAIDRRPGLIDRVNSILWNSFLRPLEALQSPFLMRIRGRWGAIPEPFSGRIRGKPHGLSGRSKPHEASALRLQVQGKLFVAQFSHGIPDSGAYQPIGGKVEKRFPFPEKRENSPSIPYNEFFKSKNG